MVATTGFLVRRLQASIDESLDLATQSEKSATFAHNRRLHIYEAAYLLAFCGWENFLEEVFLRFLCGYQNQHGRAKLIHGKSYAMDLGLARSALFGSSGYLLWHSPDYSIKRSRLWFDSSGSYNAPMETVIQSARPDLEDFAAVRHFIAHRTSDAKAKFDAAALRMSGAGVLGSRAGRFLRQETIEPVSGIAMPWLQRIAGDLVRLARQIAD